MKLLELEKNRQEKRKTRKRKRKTNDTLKHVLKIRYQNYHQLKLNSTHLNEIRKNEKLTIIQSKTIIDYSIRTPIFYPPHMIKFDVPNHLSHSSDSTKLRLGSCERPQSLG